MNTKMLVNIENYRHEEHYPLLKTMDGLKRECSFGESVPDDGRLNYCEQSLDLNDNFMLDMNDLKWLNEKTGLNFTETQFVRAFQTMVRYQTRAGEHLSLVEALKKKGEAKEKELNEKVGKNLSEWKSSRELLNDIDHLRYFDLAYQVDEEQKDGIDVYAAARYSALYYANEYAELDVPRHGMVGKKFNDSVIKDLKKEALKDESYRRLIYLFAGAAVLKQTDITDKFAQFCADNKCKWDRSNSAYYASDRAGVYSTSLDTEAVGAELKRIILKKIETAKDPDKATDMFAMYLDACLSVGISKDAEKIFKKMMAQIERTPSADAKHRMALKLAMRMMELKFYKLAREALKAAQKTEKAHMPNGTGGILILDCIDWANRKGKLQDGLKLIVRLRHYTYSDVGFSKEVEGLLKICLDTVVFACAARIMGFGILYDDFKTLVDLKELYNDPNEHLMLAEDYHLLSVTILMNAEEGIEHIIDAYYEAYYMQRLAGCLVLMLAQGGATAPTKALLKYILDKTRDVYPHIAFRAQLAFDAMEAILWKRSNPDQGMPDELMTRLKKAEDAILKCTNEGDKDKCGIVTADIFMLYFAYVDIGMKAEGMEFIKRCDLQKMLLPVTEDMLDPQYVSDKEVSEPARELGKKIIAAGEVLIAGDLSGLKRMTAMDEFKSADMNILETRQGISEFIHANLPSRACINLNAYPLAGGDNWNDISRHLRLPQLAVMSHVLASLGAESTRKTIKKAIEDDRRNWSSEVGGLVWWPGENSAARFEFIPADVETDDGQYVFPPRLLDDISKAMLMVHLHMEMDDLKDKCHGPSFADMKTAEELEKDGLIINWSPASDKFRAIYYTPLGLAFDLGFFDIPKEEGK